MARPILITGFAQKLLFRVLSCDFVDRMVPKPKHTIHEITRNLTKQF